MVLKNVTIGRGAVIAAGSIVTESVPELAVVAGVPARVLKILPKPAEWQDG
jgi:acetyltransferase-like isoleucine patch superfamily enzyme